MTDVFYSINTFGTGDLKVASNITITSGVAVLSVAQTGNIGVGCSIEYNSLTVYISAVNSSTNFDVITATGGTPSNQTSTAVTSIHHEYASRAAFLAGFTDANHLNTTDLVTNTFTAYGPCYSDQVDQTADTTELDTPGTLTTSSTYFVRFYTPNSAEECISDEVGNGFYQRHDGKWNATAYRVEFVDRFQKGDVDDDNIQLIGFQEHGFSTATGSGSTIYELTGAGFVNDSCIVRGGVNGSFITTRWVHVSDAAASFYSVNSIYYDCTVGGVEDSFNASTINLYNSVFTGCLSDCLERNSSTFIVINCANFDNTDDFDGAFTSLNYNASDDGDGSNPVAPSGGDWDNEFTDYTNRDFSILDTGNLYLGSEVTNADDNLVPSVDIIGTDRNTGVGTQTSIGAHEFVSAGTTRPLPQRVLSGCFSGPLGGPL